MGSTTAGLQGTGFKYEDQVRMSAFLHVLIDKPFLGISNITRIKLGIRDEGIWTDDLFIESKNNYYIQVKKSLLNSKSEFYDYIDNSYKDYISFNDQDKESSFFYLVTSKNHSDISSFDNFLKEISNLNYDDYLKKIELKKINNIIETIKKKLHDIDDKSLFLFLKKCRVFELDLLECEQFYYINNDYLIIENLTKFSKFADFEVYYSNLFWIISSKKETNEYLDKNYIVEKSEYIGLVYTIENKEINEEIYYLKNFIEDNLVTLDLNEAKKRLESLKFKLNKITKFNQADAIIVNFTSKFYEYLRKIKIDLDYLKNNNYLSLGEGNVHLNLSDNFFIRQFKYYPLNHHNLYLYSELKKIADDTVAKSNNRKQLIPDLLNYFGETTLSSNSTNFYHQKYHELFLIDMLNLIVKLYDNKNLFIKFGSICENYCTNVKCLGYIKIVEIKNFVDNLSISDSIIIRAFSDEKFQTVSKLLIDYVFVKKELSNFFPDDILVYNNLDYPVTMSNISLNLTINHMSFFYYKGYSICNNFSYFYNEYALDILNNNYIRETFAYFKKDTGKEEDLFLNPYSFFYDIIGYIWTSYSTNSNLEYNQLIGNYRAILRKMYRFCNKYRYKLNCR